jgi:hypothetical protein
MASSNGSQSHRAPREIDDVFVGKDWESLRQGARNVAGVRFQTRFPHFADIVQRHLRAGAVEAGGDVEQVEDLAL